MNGLPKSQYLKKIQANIHNLKDPQGFVLL